jgi:hypothetical protein
MRIYVMFKADSYIQRGELHYMESCAFHSTVQYMPLGLEVEY